jgi:hypothetical protein
MNKLLLTFVAAMLAASASAQTESLAFQARAFETASAESLQPFILEDSFAGVGACGILDIKTIRAWTLEEAADLAKPCLKVVAEKYAARMELQGGFLSAASAGHAPVTGLILKTDLVPGSKPHRDLLASLARRNGQLLGHKVRVLARGEVMPESVSAVQSALRQCIMTTVIRDIQTSADFVKIYGSCLVKNPDLKINEIRPGAGMTVTLKTEQPQLGVEALNGFVTVNAGKGPVQIMVIAYGAQVAMP